MSVDLGPPRNIENLRDSLLSTASRVFVSERILGRPEVMARELEFVRATFNRQANAAPPQDRILQATADFLRNNNVQNPYQLQLIAWGLGVPHVDNKPLLEMREPFFEFLKAVREFWQRHELLPKVWRGLLSSYFSYTGPAAKDEVGKANWDQLRSFLKETHVTLIQNRRHQPAWMLALKENPHLLDLTPCEPYVLEVLKGDTQRVKQLQENLGIPETSWFVAELVRAHVQRVCSFGEAQLKKYLPRLCEVLGEKNLYVNEGLKTILTRYSQCDDTSEHADLRQLAVARWGSPKLQRSPGWGHVSPKVKGMVLKWLIGRDLEAFFRLLASDHDADQDNRRLDFWMRYLDKIQDAYFALGDYAYNSQQKDYLNLKRSNAERFLRLDRGGSPRNNAFIMLIDRYAIVEFGTTGNACYCHVLGLAKQPFALDEEAIAGNRTQLKNKDHPGFIFRLEHRDRPEVWEDVFERRLQRLGIAPDSPLGSWNTRSSRRTVSGRPTSSQGSPTTTAGRPAFWYDLHGLAKTYGLTVQDLRDRGGYLWVTPDHPSAHVRGKLTEWGFQCVRDKGWGFR